MYGIYVCVYVCYVRTYASMCMYVGLVVCVNVRMQCNEGVYVMYVCT